MTKEPTIFSVDVPVKKGPQMTVDDLLSDIKLERRSLVNCGEVLHWHDFEALCVRVLHAHEYACVQNFRFSISKKKRFEIDVLGYKFPYLLSIDSKNWGRRAGKKSQLRGAMVKQIVRTRFLLQNTPLLANKFKETRWNDVLYLPILVTSLQEEIEFVQGCPVVPITRFNSFINELPEHAENLKHFNERQFQKKEE